MASIWCCGAECGIDGAHWTLLNGSTTFSTSSPITGARSLRCNTTLTTSSASTIATFGAGLTVFRIRVKFNSLPTGVCCIAGTTRALAEGVYFNSLDNKLYAGTGIAALGATGVTVTTGTVYYIDVRVNTTANPWLVDVQVNGTACGQRSDAVAANTSATGVFCGVAGAGVTADILFDDVLVSATTGDYPFGNGSVSHFVPTSDGTHNVAGTNDFERTLTGTDIDNATTTAFQLVDDVPLETGTPTDFINLIAPPNSTDYVEVVFGPASGVSTPTSAPRGVEVITVSAALSATANNLRLALNDNGTLDDVRNATVGSTTCIYDRKHYSDPPSAASVWTVVSGNGNFNNLRMRCFTSDPAPDPYFVGAMIEAEFSSALALSFSDSINNLSDGFVKVIDQLKTFSDDANNLADAFDKTLGSNVLDLQKTLTDDLNAWNEYFTYARRPRWLDTLSQIEGISLGLAEDLNNLLDAYAQNEGQLISLDDNAGTIGDYFVYGLKPRWRDSISAGVAVAPIIATDSFTLTDSHSELLGVALSLSDDANNLSDTYLQIEGQLLTFSEANSLIDSLALIEGFLILLSDSGTQFDALALGYGLLHTDSVTQADSLAMIAGELLIFAEVLSFTDTFSQIEEYRIADAESMALTDGFLLTEGQLLDCADSIILSDDFAFVLVYLLSLADGASLSDAMEFESSAGSEHLLITQGDSINNWADVIAIYIPFPSAGVKVKRDSRTVVVEP